MKDTRARVATSKPIDLAQLDAELGGHGLCGSGGVVVAVEGSPVTARQLAAAIEAHVPGDVSRAKARQVVLDKLGITDDEAALLLAR